MPTCLPLTALMTHIRTAYQARQHDAKQHRAAIHAQRDRERRTVGLLEIALRSQQGSIDSLTAADPGVFFTRQAETVGSRGETMGMVYDGAEVGAILSR
ncbi:hypothetical protein LTR57_004986 [Friedmanniomyces endolithicus]|nr:hypothetical protein LTR57_004986 [Friedmanniomyces endolithicus]KAK1000883.1 hypothetical protein LTS01_004890 [Friedmanniomyces endolithicus]